MESQRAVYSLELMMEMLAGLGLVVVYGQDIFLRLE
jgi:hypothetical protein